MVEHFPLGSDCVCARVYGGGCLPFCLTGAVGEMLGEMSNEHDQVNTCVLQWSKGRIS